MLHSEYESHVENFTAEMQKVTAVKNHDYSVRSDAMDNFKLIGEMLGISPRLVWSVLWMKHVTAVINHMAKDKSLRSETIHGRFIDLANYAMLGDALDKDLASPPENAAEDRVVLCPIRSAWVDMLVEAANHFKFEGGFSRLEFNTRKMAKEMKEFLDAVDGSENPTSSLHGDPAGVQRRDQVERSDWKPEPGSDAQSNPSRLAERTTHAGSV